MQNVCCFLPVDLLQVFEIFGAGGRSRTLDLRITNALLYQLSYTGIFRIAELRRAASAKLYQHDALFLRHPTALRAAFLRVPRLNEDHLSIA